MKHYNKTLVSLLAATVGVAGLHRLYLRGSRDPWLWLHLASLPASALLYASHNPVVLHYWATPVILSCLLGQLQALVLGLMRDEKWDANYNPQSSQKTASSWPLALILVGTLMVGATILIGALARLMDLMLTGGAFG